MSKVTDKHLQRMKELMGNVSPVNENKISAIESVKTSPNGKTYGIVRENKKYFIKESNDGVNFDFIDGVANKTKNQHSSYEDAVKQLNFIVESTDIIEEKRFILKSKKSAPVDSGFDFGGGQDKGVDNNAGFDFGGGDEGGDDSAGFDFGGGDESVEDENAGFDFGGGNEGDEDLNLDSDDVEDDDPIKSIQKMTGKLGQKIRDTEDLSSDTMKWVAKSIISALDLEAMDSEDKKDIIRAVKKKEDEGGSDDDFDFMDDPEDNEDDDFYPDTSFMDDDKLGDSDTVVWDELTPDEKTEIVQSFPGDTETPMMDWDEERDDSYDYEKEGPFTRGTDTQTMMFPPEEVYNDYMQEDNPNIGGDENDENLLFDNKQPYYEDEDTEDLETSPSGTSDWMSDYMGEENLNNDTYPYHEVDDNVDYMTDREEDLYGPGDNSGTEDDIIDEINVHDTVKKMKAGNSDLGHKEKLLDYVKTKLGNVDIDNGMIVGDNYFIRIDRSGFVVEKGNAKKKYFNFDEIGKMTTYVKSETDFMTDYMENPRMMPAPAPAQPTTKPGPDVKPGRPDTDKPSPTKKPFTPPPFIRPGEEPNPKAEYNEDFMEDSINNSNDDTCPTCFGRGVERQIGFGKQSKPCQDCGGTGKKTVKSPLSNEVIDEPYTENPFPYMSTSTLPKDNVRFNYNYREKFSFPFPIGESKTRKRTINEDHLNNKMVSWEQEKAYEDVEAMARQNGLEVEFCHKDKSGDPEERTVYLDLKLDGRVVDKVRINSVGEIEMGDMNDKVFKGQPVDSLSDFDEVLDEKNIKTPMNPSPAPAPTKPSTQPDVKPGRPDTDKPSPSKRPFTAPPFIRPGEEPNPKARNRNRY